MIKFYLREFKYLRSIAMNTGSGPTDRLGASDRPCDPEVRNAYLYSLFSDLTSLHYIPSLGLITKYYIMKILSVL